MTAIQVDTSLTLLIHCGHVGASRHKYMNVPAMRQQTIKRSLVASVITQIVSIQTASVITAVVLNTNAFNNQRGESPRI